MPDSGACAQRRKRKPHPPSPGCEPSGRCTQCPPPCPPAPRGGGAAGGAWEQAAGSRLSHLCCAVLGKEGGLWLRWTQIGVPACPRPTVQLGTVISLRCPSELCSVKCRTTAHSSEAQLKVGTRPPEPPETVTVTVADVSELTLCPAPGQALSVACHFIVPKPSEVGTVILLASCVRTPGLRVRHQLVPGLGSGAKWLQW